jgi:hypothetical protein
MFRDYCGGENMNTYICPRCLNLHHSAASYENLKSKECLWCGETIIPLEDWDNAQKIENKSTHKVLPE